MLRSTCLFALLAAGCVSTRTAAIPKVSSAPDGLAGRTVSVDPRVDLSGYWARTNLGRELARALKLELDAAFARAGYVIDSVDPELTVRLSADLSGSTKDLETATEMEISRGGRELVTVKVHTGTLIEVDAAKFPELAAAELVNAFALRPEAGALAFEPRRERRTRNPDQLANGVVIAAFDVFDPGEELDVETRDQLSEYMAVRVTQSLKYRTIPRAQLREHLLAEKKNSFSACVDQACQIELGKALAAEKVLAPKLIRLGTTCALTASVFDLKTETAELAASVKTRCAKEALLEAVDGLVDSLRASAHIL
jgi:hypothetical protein